MKNCWLPFLLPLNCRRSRLEANDLRAKQKEMSAVMDQPFVDFIGNSSKMQDVFNTIKKVAQTDANVLILGENGTGKELGCPCTAPQFSPPG